jgi:hypothetical protein
MTDAQPTTDGGTGNIDLLGWDTVFAMSLDAVNASISAQKTTPPSFSGTATGDVAVQGEWGAWTVLGGEGDGITLQCPITSGTLTMGSSPPVPLDGGSVQVEITLTQAPAATQLTDPTAKEGSGSTVELKANQTGAQFVSPDVKVVTIPDIPSDDWRLYAAIAAFTNYFTTNVGSFDAVFGAVRLEEEALDAGKQWLKPVQSTYGLAQRTGGTSGQINSAFGILSMTSTPSGGLPQQGFDIRMFDVFPQTSPSTNSVYAMSSTLAMQNIVAASAQHCVMGATMDDFHIVNNGVTVSNKNTLHWGNFVLKAGDDPVIPVIAPGNFQLTLDGMNFHLAISQAKFTTPDGSCDVSLSADQYFNLGAVKLSDGNYYFTPDRGLGTNSIRADVTPNKGFEITMIIESIVVGVALGFLGSVAGEALGGAVTGAAEGADGAVTASAEDLGDEIAAQSEEDIAALEDSAMEDATSSIESGGEDASGKTGLLSNKWKVWGGVLGGMFGIPIGTLPQIMQLIWNDSITQGNVPTVDDFATNFTAAIQWPAISSWQVTGGTFRAAFLLGGNAS